MPVIGLDDHDRTLSQPERADLVEKLADPVVHRSEKRRVQVARMFERSISGEPLGVSLQRIVGRVDGEVQEKRPASIPLEKRAGFLDHQIAEESAGQLDLAAVSIEVVMVRAAPVDEMGIIVDAAPHVAK